MKRSSNKRIYLDHAAATPIDQEVRAEMLSYFDARYGNPSSVYTSGRNAKDVITEARHTIAEIIGARSEEIVFTGSGTESCNLALFGVARANRAHGNHIIVSSIEHKAVLEPARQLEREGFRVSYVNVDSGGLLDVEECLSLVTDDTILVSVLYVNNEVGTVEPIAELAHALRKHRGNMPTPLLHTDACQAAGFLNLDVRRLGVDLLTLNSSKMYGPRGMGLLYVKAGIPIEPIIRGGTQEGNMRAGTESVPLIVGFAAALKKARETRLKELERLEKLRSYFVRGLRTCMPSVVINGHLEKHTPHILHVSIPGIDGETLVLLLDEEGIEVSTGAACSAFAITPSHVLEAMGLDEVLIRGSVRFSLGRDTSKEDIDRVLTVLPQVAAQLHRD